jgi:hypothetical protein
MIHELRVYEIAPGQMQTVVKRFESVILGLFKRHGIRPVTFWLPVIGTSNQLIYLLEWGSLAEREKRWDAFTSDPEWLAFQAEGVKGGPLTLRITNSILREIPSLRAKLDELAGDRQEPMRTSV